MLPQGRDNLSLVGPPLPPTAPSGAESIEAPPKQHYPLPAKLPTQYADRGVRYDYNLGARVCLPAGGGPWRVRLSDLDTDNVLYETTLPAGWVSTAKQYYIRARITVSAGDVTILDHEYDCRDREVLIQLPVGTLGDIMGWFPYASKFQRAHGCRLSVAMAEWLIPLFRDAYPEINFVTHEQVEPERYYATYNIGLFFDDEACIHQPCDFRHVGLHRTAGYILGVDPDEEQPRVVPSSADRPIAERYVCIAVQSTNAGYQVVCIDRVPVHGHGLLWNHLPHGVRDETGDRPIAERARWLAHAEFFVGLSSGLSWLAWASGIPVVMISGFTHPTNEFATPYRVINYHACNSCWNDVRVRFDHRDFLWCPRHKDTPRQFECTRLITAAQVKEIIRRIPGFTAPAETR
jgi:hypothetical protein